MSKKRLSLYFKSLCFGKAESRYLEFVIHHVVKEMGGWGGLCMPVMYEMWRDPPFLFSAHAFVNKHLGSK